LNSTREDFLTRVRQAVNAGNSPGLAGSTEPRGSTGYQGGGTDPVGHFGEQFTAVGGVFHLVRNAETGVHIILNLLSDKSARRVLLGGGELLDQLNLACRLKDSGIEVLSVDSLTQVSCQEPFFAADIGISGVDYLIAETGSVVLHSGTHQPRSLSLLPPVYIAVAERRQLAADLFDLFDPSDSKSLQRLPSCTSIVTGPSKTGDIELKLVTGVHGPGKIHVILIDR